MAQNATGDPKSHADHTDSLHKKTVDEIEHFPVNLKRQDGLLAYPAEFYKKDPREEKLQLMRQVGHDWNKDGFTVAMPEEVLDYFVQKKKYIEFANWEKWVQDNFDLTQPSEVERLKRIMPTYFERRLEYLKKLLGLTYTVHKLKLLGPENEKDMMLLYELAKGKVPVPDIVIPDDKDPKKQFNAGFFNIRKWLGTEGTMKRPRNLGSAPWGMGGIDTGNYQHSVASILDNSYLSEDGGQNSWSQLSANFREKVPFVARPIG